MTSALMSRDEYAALERCVYLNQASLGLIPRRSTRAMVDFLEQVAQHGNDRLSDEADVDRAFGSPAEMGRFFLTDQLLAFEITSIVLLVAAVGGVVLGMRSEAEALADAEETP